MIAFSKGPRQCVGMNLANAELLSTIAEMAKWEMAFFETSEEDVKFLHDYHVATPRLDLLGIRAKVVKRLELSWDSYDLQPCYCPVVLAVQG